MPRKPLTLLFDPLCGWCYGAHPGLEALRSAFELDWRLLPTGLFCRPAAMTAERAAYFWQNDQRIAQLTGQSFSQAYRVNVLANTGVPFDSTLPTRAWLLINEQFPENGLLALREIQTLRYVEGLHYTPENLSGVAMRAGMDPDQFMTQFTQDSVLNVSESAVVRAGQAAMQGHALRGVPVLLYGDTVVPTEFLYQPGRLVKYMSSQLNSPSPA